MSTPYRNEIDALRERKTALEGEITRLRDQTSGLDALRLRESELARELSAVDGRLAAGNAMRRPLPLLDQVRVASPCTADWNEMVGDARVRFCLGCEKNVFNLSAMQKDDAEALLHQRLGNELCVRFYQRADGTILTQDCPVGVKKKRRKKLALAVAGAGAMAAAAATMALTTMGARRPAVTITTPSVEEPVVTMMGAPVPTEVQAVPVRVEPRVTMGKPTRVVRPGPTKNTVKPTSKAPPVTPADAAQKQLEAAVNDAANTL